ncbi:MAG: zinc-dependent metalloprotease [Candidatus Nanopelagicales bacterium]
MADLVDWELAVGTGLRLVPRGPEVTPEEAATVVRQLRRASERAVGPVLDVTGMEAPFEEHVSVVVGRPEWVRSNVRQMRTAIEPVMHLLRDREPPAAVRAVGARASGIQMGAVLAWLSGKVLGQFEVFGARGRLLLVAPNIAHAETQLGVDATDFRLWVCLHEETHRVQFGAVPWLTDHFTSEVHTYLAATEADASSVLARVLAGVRGARDGSVGIIDLVQTPEQRAVLDRLTALMSLLEGHADVVMDAVGPLIVPSVDVIRARFDQRRRHAGTLEGALKRLLGLDAKLRQYTEGAAFVRGVVDRVGMPGFNAVWTSPETLPTTAEIAEPALWVRRVHG